MGYYRLLNEGEKIKKGDEIFRTITNEWSEVPESWDGSMLNYSNSTTVARLSIPFRRAIIEFKEFG